MKKNSYTIAAGVAWVTVILAAHAAVEIDPPALAAKTPADLPLAQQPLAGTLELINGDRISGELDLIDREQGHLIMRNPFVRDDVVVNLASLNVFRAERRAPPEQAEWTVEMTNGDSVRGSVSGMDDEIFTMHTWYAGDVRISRNRMKALRQAQGSSVLFDSSIQTDGWEFGPQGPRQLGGSFFLSHNQVLGRVIENMPPKIRLDFECEWMWHMQISLRLFADNPTDRSHAHSAYILNITPFSQADLTRITGNQGSRQIGRSTITSSRQHQQQNQARFTVLADVEKGKFELYLEDARIAEWTDSRPMTDYGKAISFSSTHSQNLELRNIRLTEWDGRSLTQALTSPGDAESHLFRLQNGDTMSGAFLGIQEGQARIETSFGTFNVPVERIEQALFPITNESPARDTNDIRVILLDDTTLTMQLESLGHHVMTGQTPHMGHVRIPMAAVRQIQWRLEEDASPQDETPLQPADAPIMVF